MRLTENVLAAVFLETDMLITTYFYLLDELLDSILYFDLFLGFFRRGGNVGTGLLMLIFLISVLFYLLSTHCLFEIS